MGSENDQVIKLKITNEKFKEYCHENIISVGGEEIYGLFNVVWLEKCFEAGYSLAKEEEKAKVEKMKKALEFYASMSNWIGDYPVASTRSEIFNDTAPDFHNSPVSYGGKLARQILKEIE